MAAYQGRISLVAYKTISAGLYAIAIIAAPIRMTLQKRVYRRLRLDDILLLFACVCLSGETVFSLTGIRDIYAIVELQVDPGHLRDPAVIFAHLDAYAKLSYFCPTLAWTTIFFVKFAYLYFFRLLLDRLQGLMIFWRTVVVITVIAYPVVILSDYETCPNIKNVHCSDSKNMVRSWDVAIFWITLGIFTDALIITLPISLLWNAQLRIRQKVGLGTFLSLNIFMAIISSVRVGGLHIHVVDEVWLFLWAHAEACVAVSMVSLIAFRSIFYLRAVASQGAKGKSKIRISREEAEEPEEVRGGRRFMSTSGYPLCNYDRNANVHTRAICESATVYLQR